jgi:hypothetical protein
LSDVFIHIIPFQELIDFNGAALAHQRLTAKQLGPEPFPAPQGASLNSCLKTM